MPKRRECLNLLARAKSLQGQYSGPAFMVLELQPGSLPQTGGIVRYPDAFRLVE